MAWWNIQMIIFHFECSLWASAFHHIVFRAMKPSYLLRSVEAHHQHTNYLALLERRRSSRLCGLKEAFDENWCNSTCREYWSLFSNRTKNDKWKIGDMLRLHNLISQRFKMSCKSSLNSYSQNSYRFVLTIFEYHCRYLTFSNYSNEISIWKIISIFNVSFKC